jgi:hypothetical protein
MTEERNRSLFSHLRGNGGILADPLVKRNKGRNMGASFKKVKNYVIIKIGDGRTG